MPSDLPAAAGFTLSKVILCAAEGGEDSSVAADLGRRGWSQLTTMKLILLYLLVALWVLGEGGKTAERRPELSKGDSDGFFSNDPLLGGSIRRTKSPSGSSSDVSGDEGRPRKRRDAESSDTTAGVTSSSEHTASGTFSTPGKGSHIPEATPTYSETTTIIGETSTWGSGVYKAFNGHIFAFESLCPYTFCRHCVESGGDFNIEIKRNNESEIENIQVLLDGNDVSISAGAVSVNGESVQIPYNNKLINIIKYGEHNVLKSRRGILSLMWDKNNKLSLTLHKQYPTCGLCGNFNSTPGQDISEHIASSKIPGDCLAAVSKSFNICDEGVQHCDSIIGTYFENCAKVAALVDDYKTVCVDAYCSSADGLGTCGTYSELSRLCAADGPGVFEGWRDDPDVVCEKPTCPENHIYKECGLSNPATCSNVAPFQDSECVSGCTCPEGYLLDDIGDKGSCVLKADCPCESNGDVYQPGEVRDGPCGSQCTCQDAKWSCTEALCPGRCKVEGSLFTTFDNNKYNHPGNCHFLAVHGNDWSISVELRPCPSGQTGTCLNSVTLALNSSVSVDKYVFNRDGTVMNDKISNQDYYYSDKIQIFKVSSMYRQVETDFHVKMQIQIVPVMQLYVSMPPNQFTDTVGLCGSYNNKAEDDFMSSENILEKTSQAFASSWAMMSCPSGTPASCVSIDTEKFAEKNCGILLDPSGPFAACHAVVNPKFYHEECKKYTCSCENTADCLCTVLGNYVKACAEKETYLRGWRAGRCELSCASGLVFKYNVKACNSSCRSLSERDRSCDVEDVPVDGCACPDGTYRNNEGNCVQKSQCDCYMDDEVIQPGRLIHIEDNTCVCQDGILLCQTPIDSTLQNCTGGAEYIDCSDPQARTRIDRTCSTRNIPMFYGDLPCKRGCYCPGGMVRNSKGQCVLPDDCPCSFGGREYDQGSVTSVGCNECTCTKGSWNCTQNECQTTCHIYGEGHVRTFDGLSYTFDGLCQYSFIEDYCGGENGTFRILTESVPCCEDGLTCSRKVIVALQDQNIVLQDGKVTALKTTESQNCELSSQTYSVHTVGLYLVLKFENGIVVIWDKNTRVSVILDPRWNGKVCGLCGNNNGDSKDDFTTRHSSMAAGALEFGNSWKTSQECSDTVAQSFPCDSNPYCKAWAVRKCEILRDSTFRECHSKVDPSTYYDACVEEACACDMEGKYQGFCTAVAMYAEACSAVGACVSWRKPDLCPVYCDYYNGPGECSWHYEPCGTVTAKTCKDQVIGQKFSALLEGCYAKCPESAPYLDENTMKCVALSDCSCFYNDVIPAGGVVQDDCGRTWYLLYCIAGKLECTGKSRWVTEEEELRIQGSFWTINQPRISINALRCHLPAPVASTSVVRSSTEGSTVQTGSSAQTSSVTSTPRVASEVASTTAASSAGTVPVEHLLQLPQELETNAQLSQQVRVSLHLAYILTSFQESPKIVPPFFFVATTTPLPGTTHAPGTSTTGTSIISPKITSSSEGSSTEATTSTEGTGISEAGFNTEALSPTEREGATTTGLSAEATSSLEGSRTTRTSMATETYTYVSETTAAPGTTTTGTTVTSNTTSGITGSSTPGTSKEALETTTAPGATPTGTSTETSEASTAAGIAATVTTTQPSETTTAAGLTSAGCPPSPPPMPVCHGPLGEEKSPGDVWVSSCHTCTCTEDNVVTCQPQECPSPPTCPSGEKLVQFQSNDTCCTIGYCEPRTCLFNDTNYEIGDSFGDPNNPCISYTCGLTGLVPVVQDCPRQTWCAEEDRIYDSNNCCYKCKNSCKSSPVNVTVRYNGCKNKVEMARCVGTCKQTVRYNYDVFQLESSCLCCKENSYEFREITLACPDGSTIPYTYRHVTTCSCLDLCQQASTPTPS
ncbi:mucin-19-like [Ochotona princeps]|uniref:mucin-19-like n=1 Tax=Ochotona princeps TaxID=9978 RepID=UPI0027145C54|nr:mucin-19-like [Ochotona princeps]